MLDGDNWLIDVPEAAQEELRSKISVGDCVKDIGV